MEEKTIRRGDIFYADFGEAEGSSMRGIRPALIISNNLGNENGPTVIVVAITSHIKAMHLPTHLVVESGIGLNKKSMLVFEQLKTIDKACLKDKIGQVSQSFLKRVDQALEASIGLNRRYNGTNKKTIHKEEPP